jgi:hypothetical protein
MPETKETIKKETKKKVPEKKKDEERIKMLIEKRFLNLEEMAEVLGKKPEAVEALIEAETIPPNCYCYPSTVEIPNSDGHQRMFLPKKTLEALEKA